jgi:hypothetical protein
MSVPEVHVTAERCDRCGAGLDDRHEHVVDPTRRLLLCTCAVCAVVATGAAGSAWRRVRPHVTLLPELEPSDALWDGLEIPIGLAFFVKSSVVGRVIAYYPGAAGVVESQLSLEAWDALVARHPVLADLDPDVEALLVNRARGARDHWRVSVDECYRLAGLVRLHWRGFTGGAALWRELDRFFAELRGAA